MALTVKNLPANAGDIRDRVQSLGREDPLEEGSGTHSSILAQRTPWTEEPGSSWGHKESDMIEQLTHMHTQTHTHTHNILERSECPNHVD